MNNQSIEERLLGREALLYLELADKVATAVDGTKYPCMPTAEYMEVCQSTISQANKIYCSEMLGRAHLAAAVSILRHREWLRGMMVSAHKDNFFAFATAFRGFIESVADSYDVMRSVPATLAENAANIERAVTGKARDGMILGRELEDTLIHFAFARKTTPSEAAPASHSTKRVRKYLEVLERADIPHLIECYSELCDLAHSGISSVAVFLTEQSPGTLELQSVPSRRLVSDYCAAYQGMMLPMLMFGFNGPLVTLALLNWFSLPAFHTSPVTFQMVSTIPVWTKIEAKLRTVREDIGQSA